MNATIGTLPRRIGPNAVHGGSPEDLDEIRRPAVSLAVWCRPPPEILVRLLDPLPVEALPHLRLEGVAVAAVEDTLADQLGARAAALRPLVEDVGMLARLYERVTGRRSLRLRLERITDDACRRLHADHVRLRLLCTYRGPGTEWLPAAVGSPSNPPEPQAVLPGALKRLDRFAVGLLKGVGWTGSQPCHHRSPPIAGTDTARLLLSIDEGQACGC